ncbi:MAG: hypothetical protein AAGC85_23175, partial [Bacteroidota bacterium]
GEPTRKKTGSTRKTSIGNSSSDAFCATVPPSDDTVNWRLISVHVEDEDWEVLPASSQTKMRSKTEFVGIGCDPQSPLEVAENRENYFRFLPGENDGPALHLSQGNAEGCRRLKLKLEEKVVRINTDAAEGYCMEQELNSSASGNKTVQNLLTLRIDEQGEVTAGIGTKEPNAALEVYQEDKGKFQVHIPAKLHPATNLVDKNHEYFSTSIAENTTCFITNAPKGYLFKSGVPFTSYCEHAHVSGEQSLVAITQKGTVGIGVDDPKCRMEADTENGSMLLNLGEKDYNPTFSLVNKRKNPGTVECHINMGLTYKEAIFTTDAQSGFVFKKDEKDENIGKVDSQGSPMLQILPVEQGRVGIGHKSGEVLHTLDVNGCTNALNHLTPLPSTDNANNIKPITEVYQNGVLDDICALEPIVFEWKSGVECVNGEQQFGLRDTELIQCMNQAVNEATQTVSYMNLVPALVQAIKEMTNKIQDLEAEVKALKNDI